MTKVLISILMIVFIFSCTSQRKTITVQNDDFNVTSQKVDAQKMCIIFDWLEYLINQKYFHEFDCGMRIFPDSLVENTIIISHIEIGLDNCASEGEIIELWVNIERGIFFNIEEKLKNKKSYFDNDFNGELDIVSDDPDFLNTKKRYEQILLALALQAGAM